MDLARALRLPPSAKRLRVMFLAKHARSGGVPDAQDGSHAVYHHELLTTLQAIGLDVIAADTYEAIQRRPDVDFVIPLLNRGGFQNSEMLAPLLLNQHGTPYLGASPILRGLSDDKHLMKLLARHHEVPTASWSVHRIGAGPIAPPRFAYDRLVVKPNASSASWGLRIVDDWNEALTYIEALQAEGHDVIVEPWTPLVDVAVPVVGGQGGSWMLPAMAYRPEDPFQARTYEEKRNLVQAVDDPLEPVEDESLRQTLAGHVSRLTRELWPFDYGRFEFRHDPASGRTWFMEVNLSCNLWSKKTISRSAALLGLDHAGLVETIVAYSMARQGLIELAEDRLAA